MHYIYLLKVDHETMKYYIGMTDDLQRRIGEHQRGTVYTTHRLKDPQLLYIEGYSSRELAHERERQLKRFSSAYYALLKRIGLEK